MITISKRRSRATFGSLPWRSRSQHDLAAKSCPALNFVIWSRIKKLLHRNNQHIETTCRAQHLGGYLEGQGHSMTLQQNCVRPITSLFEVGFYNYFREMITILRKCVPRNIWVVFTLCLWHNSDTVYQQAHQIGLCMVKLDSNHWLLTLKQEWLLLSQIWLIQKQTKCQLHCIVNNSNSVQKNNSYG
jgi:hypothetical protein